jgi:DNA polymerase-3 subunit delta
LQEALGKRDLSKALRIIQYFGSNPKAGPIQLILPSLYGFFSKVAVIFESKGMDEKSIAASVGINPYVIKNYVAVTQYYNYNEVEKILLLLHQYNLRSIGVGDTGTPAEELLKELVMKIMS